MSTLSTEAKILPHSQRRSAVRKITVTAMLSAVAFALMFVEFPIPALIPSFVKMDVSDLPALLGAFSLGPASGIVISLLKNVLHILIKGTTSGGVGELCNFVLGAAFACAAGVIYQRSKSRKTAILGAVAGAVFMGLLSVPLNYFVTYPMYTKFMPLETIIGMYQLIRPSANGLLECLITFNMPFTILKGLLDAVLCFLIYKPLSPILHGKND